MSEQKPMEIVDSPERKRPESEPENSLVAALRDLAPSRAKRGSVAALRVLIVDDEEAVRKFVDRVLRDAGYDTTMAGDGPEAMEVAGSGDGIDLLVTDVMMPQMNGDELARRLRQNDPQLKVLYLTGFADQLFKDKLTLWEGEAFLDKPCSVKGLQQAVSLLASGRIVQDKPEP